MKIIGLNNYSIVESQDSGCISVDTARLLTALEYQLDRIPPNGLRFLSSWRSRAYSYRLKTDIANWVYSHQVHIATYNLVVFYGVESALAVYVPEQVITLSEYDRNFAVHRLSIDPKKIHFIEPCLPEVFAALLGHIDTSLLVESIAAMIQLYSKSPIFTFPSVHESL